MSPTAQMPVAASKVIVHMDASLHRQAGRPGEVEVGRRADAGDERVRLQAFGQPILVGDDADAVVGQMPLEVGADLRSEEVVPDDGVLHDQRHVEALHAGAGGCLDADEAPADHGQVAAPASEDLTDPLGVLDRADGQRVAERPCRGAGGQGQPPVADPLAVGELDLLGCRVDRRHLRAEPQVDLLLRPPLGRVHVGLLSRFVAAQELLGQGRAVVGRPLLAADDQDGLGAARLTVGLTDHAARETPADDHVVVPRH